jgi:hypothetical protein
VNINTDNKAELIMVKTPPLGTAGGNHEDTAAAIQNFSVLPTASGQGKEKHCVARSMDGDAQ